jgi:hypothetical protein
MAGDRTFDDDRWPDEDGHACCFLCGKRVDPKDPNRASYTSNAKAGGFLPGHGQCFSERLAKPGGQIEIEVAHRVALMAMSDVAIEREMRLARCSSVQPGFVQ